MTTKISIDHKTIRMLCDADPAFELELKEKILQSALRHRCVTLAHEMGMDRVNSLVWQVMKESVDALKDPDGLAYLDSLVLSYTHREEITKAVQKLIKVHAQGVVRTHITDAVKEGLRGEIREQVTKILEGLVDDDNFLGAENAKIVRDLRAVLNETQIAQFRAAVEESKKQVVSLTSGFADRIETYLNNHTNLQLSMAIERTVDRKVKEALADKEAE